MGFYHCLEKAGLRFHNPVMEKSYLVFKDEENNKIFLYQNLLFTVGAVSQLLIGFLFDNLATIDFIFASLTVVALAVRTRIPKLYEIFFTLYPVGLIYVVTVSTLNAKVAAPIPYNYMMGNFTGLIEVLIFVSIKKVPMRIILVFSSFSAKMIALKDDLHSEDSLIWNSLLPVIFIVSNFYRDYLERKSFRMIFEAKQRLEKFQTLLSRDFPSNVIITDITFTSILYSNQFFSKMFDSENQNSLSFLLKWFKVESVLKPSTTNLINQNETLADFANKLSSDPALMRIDEVIILSATFDYKEENPQHYEIRLRKILWEGEPCYTIILNDTSDKHMITALKYADEQKDRVIATVSHELRTPINGILGLLEMIGLKVEDITAKIYLQHCKNCSKLLLYLVNSILDLNLLRENRLHIAKNLFNLEELLEEMKSLYIFQTQQKGIEFIVNTMKNAPKEIYTDKFRLIEILINLLSNALKFTFKGSITLSVDIDPEDSHKVRFKVIDTGLGIKEEDKPKLFQMFGKLKQENKNINSSGVGLGLTIANSLVKALNEDEKEKIELDSEYQKGSIFAFRIPFESSPDNTLDVVTSFDTDRMEERAIDLQEVLPGEDIVSTKIGSFTHKSIFPLCGSSFQRPKERSKDKTLFRASISPLLNPLEYQTQNVLIVDDNPFNLLTVSFLLEKYGLSVTKATSGEQCIQLLKKSLDENNLFKLILMDIQMPIQDGIETTKIINSKIKIGELYSVPIIALTANKIGDKDLKMYKESGMINAIEKPLKEEALRNILNTFIFDSSSNL